jgi:hypothetical protein
MLRSFSRQSLQSEDRRYIRHSNFIGKVTPVASDVDQFDAPFDVVAGLAADRPYISFRAANFPNHYLRHKITG